MYDRISKEIIEKVSKILIWRFLKWSSDETSEVIIEVFPREIIEEISKGFFEEIFNKKCLRGFWNNG